MSLPHALTADRASVIIFPKGEKNMYSVILFDFDGTVYDTVEGITRSVQFALRRHGVEAQLSELRCFAGPPLTDMFREKYGFDLAEAEQATRDFRERYVPIGVYESRPFPDIRGLAESLRAAGKRLGIATSKPQRLAETLLEKEGLRGYFDTVCGSGENGNNDAKWQVIERAMTALNASPKDTVLIGDTKYDVVGARRVGLPCIGVRWGYAAPGELEAAGASAIVDDCAALEALLLEG